MAGALFLGATSPTGTTRSYAGRRPLAARDPRHPGRHLRPTLSTPPTSTTTGATPATPSTPAPTPGPGARATPEPPWPGRCTTTRSTRPSRLDRGPRPGRRDGRARARRGQPAYADAARLGHLLADGHRCHRRRTGRHGGRQPRRLAGRRGAGDLDEALAMLAEVPSFRPSVRDWAAAARPCGDRFPTARSRSASPPGTTGTSRRTSFATAIAKYFHNAAREAILLQVCGAGIVFLPGPAAPCRRCSRTPARTTTPTSPRWRRWCWSARSTGPRSCRPGRCCEALARRGAGWSRRCTSSTPSRRPPRWWAG